MTIAISTPTVRRTRGPNPAVRRAAAVAAGHVAGLSMALLGPSPAPVPAPPTVINRHDTRLPRLRA